jgi:hypothetical protein
MEATAAQQDKFRWFVRAIMGVPLSALPDAAPVIPYALTGALAIVNRQILTASPFAYDLALNNLAGHFLMLWAQDPPGQTFFAEARKSYGLHSFTPGMVQSSADESTSNTLFIPDFFKGLTLADLQYLKTPYGRQYLEIAQSYGPSVWGLT